MMYSFFFFKDTATTEIYTSIDTLSLHDALPISACEFSTSTVVRCPPAASRCTRSEEHTSELQSPIDISYAVFCLKKKKIDLCVLPIEDTCRGRANRIHQRFYHSLRDHPG